MDSWYIGRRTTNIGSPDYTILSDINTNWVHNIDLRKEYDQIMKDFGHMVLIRRNNMKIHCNCWNNVEHSSPKGCVDCLGSGRVNVIEKVVSRRTTGITGVGSRSEDVTLKGYGQVMDPPYTFYFHHFVMPQVGDKIYEVTWDDNGMPLYLLAEFTINYAESLRGDYGRIEYWRCAGKYDPINRYLTSVNIRRVRDIVNYDIMWGR